MYPAIVVVLSNNLFTYNRYGTACTISSVSAVTNQTLYNYITDAAKRGTKVVIRIYPSPADFQDTFGIGSHLLLSSPGARPQRLVGPGNYVVADYCSDPIPGDGLPSADYYFRSVDDIANEIIAIRNFTSQSGWEPYAFEPANEPNATWWSLDALRNAGTWASMDAYFRSLYGQVHPGSANPDIRMLAPPMAQSAYAEERNVLDCSTYFSGWPGGLTYMPDTWMGSYNDGWSWHNYWMYGHEGATPDNSCMPGSGHNFQAFPATLKALILGRAKPALISEADLCSPCIGNPGNLPDKGETSINQHGANAGDAIKVFIRQEQGASYVAVWNLTITYSDSQNCNVAGTNDEYAWHEAYRSSPPYERYWFWFWWMDTTQP